MADDIPPPPAAGAAPLDVEAVRVALSGLRLGHPLVYLPAVASTNSHALELARQGAAEGTLVTTDDQTAGRGRVGRPWKSLPGQQLALSLVLRPSFTANFLMMASALAVADAIASVAPLRPDLKWPNDILVGGRKICGILIETSEGVVVLGIGVNVNGSLASDPELAARAATLAEAAGRAVSREALLAAIVRQLDAVYFTLADAAGRAAVREAWRARLATLGRPATVTQHDQTLTGLAEDVDADGALLLRTDDGALRTITWGDVNA